MNDEEITPSEQPDEGFGGENLGEGTPEESSQPQETPQEIDDKEIELSDGTKVKESQIQEALQAREDYNYLLPEFTRRSQKLAELEKQVAQVQNQPNVPQDQKLEETKRILKEQLGMVTKDELQKMIGDVQSFYQGDVQLQKAVTNLGKKYSGESGEPKFDYDQLKDYLVQKYGDNQDSWPNNIDLEYEYWDMNRDYFSKIPKVKSAVARTERRSSTPFSLEKKRIKFEPTGKGEVSAEDAAKEILRQYQ